MSQNFVRIYRYPLITNVFSPLKWDLPDDIDLPSAEEKAVEFGKKHDRWNVQLYHNGKRYIVTKPISGNVQCR